MRADPARIEADVRALAGERHPGSSPDALLRAEDYVARALRARGLEVSRPPFPFRGREYRNVVGRLPGDPSEPRVLVGAHFDTVTGTPGADDNASGVAAMLEVARLLTGNGFPTGDGTGVPAPTVELVGFNLEEPQGGTYRVGSRAWARRARERGVEYAGCLILEMVGYTDPRPGSQSVPPVLFWKRIPDAGTFLAAAGDGKSRRLLRTFREVAEAVVPDLEVVTQWAPFRGWLVPATRLSDNASFWDRGYPALMLTDTSFLRNPHYHRGSDAVETLDFPFAARAVDATAATVRRLAALRAPT